MVMTMVVYHQPWVTVNVGLSVPLVVGITSIDSEGASMASRGLVAVTPIEDYAKRHLGCVGESCRIERSGPDQRNLRPLCPPTVAVKLSALRVASLTWRSHASSPRMV